MFLTERKIIMAQAQTVESQRKTNIRNDAVNILLAKLDEAIDDMEKGRVQTIDEAWEEIDAV